MNKLITILITIFLISLMLVSATPTLTRSSAVPRTATITTATTSAAITTAISTPAPIAAPPAPIAPLLPVSSLTAPLGYSEVVDFSQLGDMLEVTERLGEARSTITEFEMTALTGKVYTDKNGISQSNQYLKFDHSSEPIQSMAELLSVDPDRNELGDYLSAAESFNPTDAIFEWSTEWQNGFVSDITPFGNLVHLENEKLRIMSNDYYVANAYLVFDIIFLDIVKGGLSANIVENRPNTFYYDGQLYNIRLLSADPVTKQASFMVNGFTTAQIYAGEMAQVGNDQIALVDVSSTPSGDTATFVLNGDLINVRDNWSDNVWTVGPKFNNEDLEEVYVRIKGNQLSPTEFELNSIEWRMNGESKRGGDVFLEEGNLLSTELDEAQGMINQDWNIYYGGLDIPATNHFIIDANGDDEYNLKFVTNEGLQYNVPLADTSNGLKMGSENDMLWFVEPSQCNFVVEPNDYFILTNQATPIDTAITHVLRYEAIDDINNEMTFEDMAVGILQTTYQQGSTLCPGAEGEGTIISGGNSFRYIVGPAPLFKLSIDLNGNGQIILDDEAPVIIKGDVVSGKGGAIYNIGSDSLGFAQQFPTTEFNSKFATLDYNIEEPTVDEVTYVRIFQQPGNEIDLEVSSPPSLALGTVASGFQLLQDPQAPNYSKVRSRYGALFELFESIGQPKEFRIEYPIRQVEVKAYAVYKNTFLCGDINQNGVVDITDALVASQAAAGLFGLSFEQQRAGDVDSSGFVNIIDALFIARYSSGLPVVLNCPA